MIKSLIMLDKLFWQVIEDCFDDVCGLSVAGSDALADICEVQRAVLQCSLPEQREIIEWWQQCHTEYSYQYDLQEIAKRLSL